MPRLQDAGVPVPTDGWRQGPLPLLGCLVPVPAVGQHQGQLALWAALGTFAQASSALTPTYTCQASNQRSSQSSHGRSKDKSKKDMGHGHDTASSCVTVTFHNPQAQTQEQISETKKGSASPLLCLRWGGGRARLLWFGREWALLMEDQFILEVVVVEASLVFPVRPPLSNLCISFFFLAPSSGQSKGDALIAEIQAMVTKGAVMPLPQDSSPGFYCNLFFMLTNVTGDTSL